jgi:peptide/nickel transport system permease protein
MTRYLAKRVAFGLLTLFLFVTFLFFVVNILVPGDWTSQFILTAEQRAELQERVGLDRSLWEQYWTWISGAATLNLGESFAGYPVWSAVRSTMATTLFIFLGGMAIAFPLGNWLGRTGAWRGRGWFLGWTSFVAILFFTAFPPSLAFLLDRGLLNATSPGTHFEIVSLDRELWQLPPAGPGFQPFRPVEGVFTPSGVMWRMVLTLVVLLVVLAVADRLSRLRFRRGLPGVSLLGALVAVPWLVWGTFGWQEFTLDLLGTVALLALGVVLLFYGEMQLVSEAAMEDAVDEDYVLTARAKGLADARVRDRHAARAALLPVLSRLVVSLPYFLTGLAILESVFEVPGGLGNLVFYSIRNQDTPVVVGAMAVIGALALAARLLMDVLHAVLDPRIRYGSGRMEVDVG